MSRIGKKPVAVPNGVTVTIDGQTVKAKGPKGELQTQLVDLVTVSLEDNQVSVKPVDQSKPARSAWGMSRTLVANLITGVTDGFTKKLEINGVGYRAEVDGKNLVLNVGYSHPVVVEPPEGIEFEVDMRIRQIKIKGYDKQMVGQIASNIRKVRPPEPYQGKGIKYIDEKIRRKAGKAGKV